jgi:hypothetical protein
MEKLLCAMVEDDISTDQLTTLCPGISRPADGATVEIDHSRVNLVDCRAAVNAIPAVRDSLVRLEEHDGKQILTAYVHVAERDLTIAQLHHAVVARLAPHGRAMAPQYYRLHGMRPAVLDEVSAWDRAELISEGRGLAPIHAATQIRGTQNPASGGQPSG